MRTKHFSRNGRKLSLAIILMVLLISGQRAWTEELDTAKIIWTTKLSLSDEIWAAKFFANGDSIVVVEKNRVFVMDARTGKIGDVLQYFHSPHNLIIENERYLYNDWGQKFDLNLRYVVDGCKFSPYGGKEEINQFSATSFSLYKNEDKAIVGTHHSSDPWQQYRKVDSNLVMFQKSSMTPIFFKSVNGFIDGIRISDDGNKVITRELNTNCCKGNILTNEDRLVSRDPITLENIKTIHQIKDHGGYVNFDFSPDSKYFIATTTGNSVYIWETENWKLVSNFYLHYIKNGDLCFSCNSKYLLAQYVYDGEEPKQYGMNIYSLQPVVKKIRRLILNDTLPDGTMSRIIPKALDCEHNKLLGVTVVYDDGYKWALSLIDLPEFVTSVGSNNTTDNEAILYPNPTNGTITINFNEELTEPTTMELSNETGRIMFSTIIGTGTREYLINTRELPEGMYICNVRSHNFTRTYKIMVVR